MSRKDDVLFYCIDDGCERKYSYDKTHRTIWDVDLAYVVLAKWCRLDIDGHPDEFHLDEKPIGHRNGKLQYVCRTDIRLLQSLLLHKPTPVTAYAIANETGGGREVTRYAFIKQKERLSQLFPPGTIIPSSDDTEFCRSELGYMFRRALRRFMVVRLIHGELSEEEIQALLSPPD